MNKVSDRVEGRETFPGSLVPGTGRGDLIANLMTGALRLPLLAFGYVVDRIRRLPGARFASPVVPWLVRGAFIAAAVLLLLWMAEASPQRMSLADLAAGKLSPMQSWVIISGDLRDDRGSQPGAYRYRLTDAAAPNAYLDVRSSVEWPLGSTTLSGQVLGGRDGVPAGYEWSAPFQADAVLADELPPPAIAFGLIGLGVVVVAARRTSYPMFIAEAPARATSASGGLRVRVRADRDAPAGPVEGRVVGATLSFDRKGGGAAELRVSDRAPLFVRLHSAFTHNDVGRLRSLSSSEPALRVRAADDDLILVFESARDRDAAFATLGAEAQRLRPSS